MDDAKNWSSKSNDAVRITLKNPLDSTKDVQFQPALTYPIFGEEETIFGYQKLRIGLSFQADSLRPALEIGWRNKYETVGETTADDVEEKLKPYLPTLYNDQADTAQPEDASSFEPPGELLHQYEVNGRSFGIWSALLTDLRAKQIVRHMQILIPLFIEGGTCIELDDPEWTIERWRVFFLYAIDAPPDAPNKPMYSFAGYSTAYRLFFLDTAHPDYYTLPSTTTTDADAAQLNSPDTFSPSTLPSRQRISQFLITPPYQSSSHGSHLYNTMLTHSLSVPTTAEITVEDPNESFDVLRDVNDLLRLRRSLPAFASLTINTTTRLPPSRQTPLPTATLLDPSAMATIRASAKLAPRQLARLTEMQLLSTIPPLHRSTSRITRRDRSSDDRDRAYYFWRLLVKQRLYKHNRDMMMQMEVEERVESLEDVILGVEREYVGVLEKAERRERREDGERGGGRVVLGEVVGDGGGSGSGKTVSGRKERQMQGIEVVDVEAVAASAERRKAKRKLVDDEDEDEDGAGGEVATGKEKEGSNGGAPVPDRSKRAKTVESEAHVSREAQWTPVKAA